MSSGQLVVTREGLLDEMEVRVELLPTHADADVSTLARGLQHRIKVMIGVSTRVTIGAPGSVERTLVGKAKRVVDRRPR